MTGGLSDRRSGGADLSAHVPPAAVAAFLLTAVIFVVDTFTPLGYAIAVLYALVVILSATFLERRGVMIVALVCTLFTVVGFLAGHGFGDTGALARAVVSITAIAVATVLTLRDKQSMEAVRAQATLLDLTHDAIFTRTPDGIVTFWNRGAEELYGWTRDQAVGRHVRELSGCNTGDDWVSANRALMASGRWEGEVSRTRRDGTNVTVACRWSLRRDMHGMPVAILETHNDITARIESQLALDRARMELAHAARLSALGELTASIAHEVNQPLAAVVTSGEACLRWLKRDPPDWVEVTASVERMNSAARRASDVIARLRALARKTDGERTAIVLNEIVEDVLLLLQREMAAHDVLLKLESDPTGAAVVGDKVQLQQVLINLIVNAIQAMDANRGRNRVLEILAARDGAADVILTVSDNGPGFTDETMQRLFSAFFTTKPDGMGIGLSICRRIIEAHGGNISAAANAPFGATFHIRLPVVREEA